MSPASIRVRVTVTVETDAGRETSWSQSVMSTGDFALSESSAFAGEEARRRVQQLYRRITGVGYRRRGPKPDLSPVELSV